MSIKPISDHLRFNFKTEMENCSFETLLLNDEFISKITGSGSDNKRLINELSKSYPVGHDEIALAVVFIRQYAKSRIQLTPAELERIRIRIVAKIREKALARKRRLMFLSRFGTAAAVIIMVLATWFMFSTRQNQWPGDIAETVTMEGGEAVIVLSDGTRHLLGENNTLISYGEDGSEVRIEKTNEVVDLIENRASEKQSALNQVIVPWGRRHSLQLSDGTRIQLNSGSHLVYPPGFAGKTREVYLKGEAWFEVAEDINKPFIVNTDNLNVKVLGTSFNVSAYPDDEFVSTVLVEGSVEISHKGSFLASTRHTLMPGQGCFYAINTGSSEVKTVSPVNYVSWKDGWLQFSDEPARNIIRKVKKYYNKNIEVEGKLLPYALVSGKLVLTDNYENALANLAKTLEARLEKTDDGNYLFKE